MLSVKASINNGKNSVGIIAKMTTFSSDATIKDAAFKLISDKSQTSNNVVPGVTLANIRTENNTNVMPAKP